MDRTFAARLVALATLVVLASAPARAAFTYTESVSGDLSNNRLAPTALVAGAGINTLTGTTVTIGGTPAGRDFDYATVNIPTGFVLDSIVLKSYSGADLTFLGMMAGSPFTVDPAAAFETIPPQLLGWAHLTPSLIGTNLFPIMASQTLLAPVAGFTAPLGAGNYSFWIQEANATTANYALDFNVRSVPEPGTLGLLALAAGLMAGARRLRAR